MPNSSPHILPNQDMRPFGEWHSLLDRCGATIPIQGILKSALVLILCIVLPWLFHARKSGIKRNGHKLPRPPAAVTFGEYGLWFLQPRHKLLQWFADMAPEMGLETYQIPIPSLPPAVLVNDPVNLEFVLKNNDVFVKGDFFRSNSWDLFANGILNTDGELWRIQRKAGLRFLSNANIQYFVDDVLPPLLANMHTRLEAYAASGAVFDLQAEFFELTTRLMGKVAYNMDITPRTPFASAFDYASAVTADRFTNPFWRITNFFNGSRFASCINEVKSFGLRIVADAQRRNSTKTSSIEGKDRPLRTNLIDSFIAHIPDSQIVADAAVNYLSAGRDTTGQSMTWTVYYLLRHPAALQKALQEIERKFPALGRGDALNLSYSLASESHSFVFAQATFAETLRLMPAVPLELKELNADATLPDGTELPKGSVVIWIPYSMARCPQLWGSDAALFKPERWIDKDSTGRESLVVRSAFMNPVFNAGPRMCIGKRLAEILATRVLVELLWKWDLEEVRGEGEVDGARVVGESLTAPMDGGLPVRISRPEAAPLDKQEMLL